MASSSSSSKHNVFLSFRREDTGRTFVSHLYRSLDRKGLRSYKDGNQQTGDGRISPEVAKTIRESMIFVVVISDNYASSAWCLEVLAKIIARSRHIEIKTVFYEVDPEVITGKFADDVRRHAERVNPETVNRWSNALERLKTTGHKFCSRDCEDDSKMIDDLIISISSSIHALSRSRNKLAEILGSAVSSAGPSWSLDLASCALESMDDSNSLELMDYSNSNYQPLSNSLYEYLPTGLGLERFAHEDTSVTDPVSDNTGGLVGMYRHKKAVYALLDLESNNQVRVVGIWGRQGVGKTTLAEYVFDDISGQFQHHCFLAKVNNIYQNRISPSLLKHLPSSKTFSDVFDAIKPSLVNQKVLVVIDGLESYDDTQSAEFKNALEVIRRLGLGSRVIMTSSSEYVLQSCGEKYKMECLRYEEALELFSIHAFKKTCPLNGFESYSIRAVHFAGCLPLALKVLGSFLYGKDEESWKTTLHKLEATQDNGSRKISNYIAAPKYLPRRQTELEQYVRLDEGCSHSYHMLL